jgi:drug/metabolite transporter (DMT)-like permease
MWFPLALTGMFMLVLRRSTEKRLTGPIPAGSMAWLQQLAAMPFMLALLPFATFYMPNQLSLVFYAVVILYVLVTSLDVILYFKAIEVGDISVISPLISLGIVTSLIGTYFILGQVPTFAGIIGSLCIIVGAYFASHKPASHISSALNNRLAIILVLIIVMLRGIYSPAEVIAIRLTNPIYFNFVTSLLSIPVIMFVMWLRGRATGRPLFSQKLLETAKIHRLGLLFIGLTYTINLTATYTAKLISPNAAYVTTIKGAQVLPMVLVGMLFFREKIHRGQWFGLALILTGLACFLVA